jgi:hypothetical protein
MNKNTLAKRIAVASALTLLAGSASAQSIVATTNDFVRAGSSSSSDQDSSENLLFKTTSTGTYSRYTYIRFDVTDLITTLTNATSVTLDMYQFAVADASSVLIYSVNDGADFDPGVSTTETTWGTDLTWDTRPDSDLGLANANTTFLSSATLLSSNNNNVVSWTLDLTNLDTLLAADTNNQITFVIGSSTDATTNTFASLTNTGGFAVPTLTYAVPEPSTFAALAGLIALGAVMVRRRRA